MKVPEIYMEGMSGSGKTTAVNALSKKLTEVGIRGKVIIEKEHKPFSDVIKLWYDSGRPFVNESWLKMITMARLDTHSDVIQKINADILIFDRSFFTTAVYQEAYNDPMRVIELNLQHGISLPEKLFILECHPQLSYDRVYKREKKFPYFKPNLEYFSNAHEKFRYLTDRIRNVTLINTERNSIDSIIDYLRIQAEELI